MFPGFFAFPETLWNVVKRGEKNPENILQKMKKTEQKIYAMEQTKIHERIEEKKREATQQHSL